MTIQEQANKLIERDYENWSLMASNYDGLKSVQLKSFEFDGFKINVQFNPKRITSSAAKVDKKSIDDRKCFLCSAHRPDEQSLVKFGNDYEILCNPFPIFPKHYTIAHVNHIPQEIENSFDSFLDISKALPELLCFYNAPNCGASAPDHLHFQAGNTGFVPLEKNYETICSKYGIELFTTPTLSVTGINDGLRRFIVLEGQNKAEIKQAFSPIYSYMKDLANDDDPMLNIVSWYSNKWRIMIFLREKHRPWQYFEEGDKNILLSPASVDFCGTLITPLEKDFLKITKDDIIDIFNQVSLGNEAFNELSLLIKNTLTLK